MLTVKEYLQQLYSLDQPDQETDLFMDQYFEMMACLTRDVEKDLNNPELAQDAQAALDALTNFEEMWVAVDLSRLSTQSLVNLGLGLYWTGGKSKKLIPAFCFGQIERQLRSKGESEERVRRLLNGLK